MELVTKIKKKFGPKTNPKNLILKVFFSAYISEFTIQNTSLSSTFAHTGLIKNWHKIYIQLTIYSKHFHFPEKRESLVPSKTSVASLSFALSPLHHIHGHRSLRAGVKNKLELRSNSVPLLLSSRSQFTAIKMGLTSHPPPSSNGRGGAGPPVQLPILAVSVTGSSGVGHLPPSWW